MKAFMQAAIDEAKLGLEEGGIPIGSVLVHEGKIIGRGHNRRIQSGSCVLHAEMDALENAGRQSAKIYQESTLYTTLSPCAMCSGAVVLYGIPNVIIAENHTFMGEESWLKNKGVELTVLQNDTCIKLMENFIKHNPDLWHEDIGV
jgi:cytosine deaminase